MILNMKRLYFIGSIFGLTISCVSGPTNKDESFAAKLNGENYNGADAPNTIKA